MTSKKTISLCISLFLIIFLSTTAFRCNDDAENEFVPMSFIVPISMTPENSIIRLGDTLWLKASFSEELVEFNSNKTFSLPNFNFKTFIVFKRLVGNHVNFSEQPGSAESFIIINKVGAIRDASGTFGDFILNYQDGRYSCRIALIPKNIGVFSIGFLWWSNNSDNCSRFGECIQLKGYIQLPPTSDGKKRIPVYNAFYHVINNGRVNHDLLLQHSKGIFHENVIDDIYYLRKGTFTIEVVE